MAELASQFVQNHRGIFNDVMQNCRRHTVAIQAHIGQDSRDRQGVIDVRPAAMSLLSCVDPCTERTRALNDPYFIRLEVILDIPQ
jgi:hypothetical protein